MLPKIALEEHFLVPEIEPYWGKTVEDVEPRVREQLFQRLHDFGDMRLEMMDEAGIELSVLSAAGPGVQDEPDTKLATRLAKVSNDRLAEETNKRPDRYAGLAHLALQDPKDAAAELERCVSDLGFCGAMINGHTNGSYLDDPIYFPFWERAEALGVPVYLHPADPVQSFTALAGHTALKRATWEWALETGSHALRLVFSGLFDRFPNATLVLGHLGETLPYLLWRFDSRAKLYGVKLARSPSDYIRENIAITTSGVNAVEPLTCALSALGTDRVMFAADYPFETVALAANFIDSAAIEDSVRVNICTENAKRIFRLVH
jgi:2,3-dihydroxybenzoate decarboxylase